VTLEEKKAKFERRSTRTVVKKIGSLRRRPAKKEWAKMIGEKKTFRKFVALENKKD